ncbi:MAG: hypothetical protein KME17_26340 [Cyanosarcina radialis HA8281-LM2]|nr:hypothetical protein [Cyanosarcina radialis HA8281-LM2]
MTRFYQTDNLEVLAQHLDEWFNCDEAGVDEEGLYGISTNNPQGWWDSWVIENWIDSLEDKSVFSIGEFIELIDEDPEISPMVVVEPDGKWHDQEGVDPTWQKEILSNYPDYLVVLCDLHI